MGNKRERWMSGRQMRSEIDWWTDRNSCRRKVIHREGLLGFVAFVLPDSMKRREGKRIKGRYVGYVMRKGNGDIQELEKRMVIRKMKYKDTHVPS